MHSTIQQQISGLRLLEPQVYRNIVLFPLHTLANGSPIYVTLGEATTSGALQVSEVSEGGTVPELLVVNRGGQPVLLLDGEELHGAKQNRVLNTSILLREQSETKIPVSCTEQGRWAYTSAHFSPSDVVMEKKIRSSKSKSVTASLIRQQGYQSDQGEVWDGIAALHAKAGTHSPTSAMHDAFSALASNLKECLEAFRYIPSQQGLLVVVNGKVEGFDIISRPEAYARVHEKLVRSYVFDALLEPAKAGVETGSAAEEARGFLSAVVNAREAKFQSVGYGWDFRYEAEGLAGSVLMHEEHVVHLAFFSVEPREAGASMATLRQRRRHVME